MMASGVQPRPLRYRGRLNRRGRNNLKMMARSFGMVRLRAQPVTVELRLPVALGQLRRWVDVPQPSWLATVPHQANGKTFRVDNLNDVNGWCHGLYEPPDPATFTSAGRDFMEAHSVVVMPARGWGKTARAEAVREMFRAGRVAIGPLPMHDWREARRG